MKLRKILKIIYKSVFNLISVYHTPTTGTALWWDFQLFLTQAFVRREED